MRSKGIPGPAKSPQEELSPDPSVYLKTESMTYPDYYHEIEHIVLKDHLSQFLGSTGEGIIDFSYLDIVKTAGHGCVLVSGTYLMALKGLKKLYGNEMPVRGEIKVELRGTLDEGNSGAAAQVLSNITGATANTGFQGIQGKYNRRGLLYYGANISSNVRFTRLDTQESMEVFYTPERVVQSGPIMQSAIGPNATEESRKTFPKRWQEMVKTIFQNADKVIDTVQDAKMH